jgi:hypothetical protein
VINGITNSTFNITSTNSPTGSPVSSTPTSAPVSMGGILKIFDTLLAPSNIIILLFCFVQNVCDAVIGTECSGVNGIDECACNV